MKYLSLFSGIGTAEKGIEQAYASNNEYARVGKESESQERTQRGVGTADKRESLLRSGSESAALCIGYSEIDKYATAIYRHHWPDVRNFRDATKLVPDTLPDFDFLVAGFPCQAFSIAGKRQGFNEARGTLFFEIARILSHKRPGHFLLENVGGLRSHDSGRTMQRILRVLSDLGYFVEVPLLNSKDYGVPQNRERVFFIGHLAERCEREILSIGQNGEEPDGTIHGLRRAIRADGTTDGESGDLSNESLLQTGADGHIHQGIEKPYMLKHRQQSGEFRRYDEIAETVSQTYGTGGGNTPLIVTPVLTPDRLTKRQNGRRFKEDGDESFTLTAQDIHGVMIEQMDVANCLTPDAYLTRGERNRDEDGKAVLTSMCDRRIRRLTPIECERLQGLPDDFTKYGLFGDKVAEISDTQRYKTCGNAMTTFVVEAIVTRMIETGCLPGPVHPLSPERGTETQTNL